jgi:tetratricopeptide (TPR) repeat protein
LDNNVTRNCRQAGAGSNGIARDQRISSRRQNNRIYTRARTAAINRRICVCGLNRFTQRAIAQSSRTLCSRIDLDHGRGGQQISSLPARRDDARCSDYELKKGLEYFQQAIAIDRDYALAYAGLADCYAVLGNFSFLSPKAAYPKAKMAALKALEMDDTLPEPHSSLAWVKTQYDWDWPGAERKFKHAIELNPDYTPAHYWYALFLSAMGRHEEGLAQARRAHEIEPLSLLPNIALGWTLYFARQYSDAAEQWRRTVEMEPNSAWARWLLGSAYEQIGMQSESLAELEAALKRAENRTLPLAMLGYGYAASGKRNEALEILK